MKNWRNGSDDLSPPIQHKDLRPCVTKIGFNGVAVAIIPGPALVSAQSIYTAQEK